jgi:ADP-ribosylglycohydrolase
MRAAPVGLCFPNSPQRLCQVAHEQSFITHKDQRCSAGSIAIAGAAALALLDRVEPVSVFCVTLANWMRPYHDEFANLVSQLPDWIKLPPDEAVEAIAPAGRQPDFEEVWPGISPFVIPSVLWSLYSFLRHPDSYSDAVATALAAGGDVDTTAAMTGAVSGAYLGASALPQHLIRSINDLGGWGHDELVRLTDELHALCEAGELS